jgi:DNA polymerase-3 subunit delta
MDGLAFLEKAGSVKLQPVYVLHGDEDFLKRQVVAVLRTSIFGSKGDDFGFSSYEGEIASFTAIRNELETLPFTGSRRLIVVDSADSFVTKFRGNLEKYLTEPASNGILVITLKSLPKNTRLAKILPNEASISCAAPEPSRLPAWCIQRAAAIYQKKLSRPAADLLVHLIGAEMGQLDQELTKLSIYVGETATIEADNVDKLVGCSREENTFKIFDAIGQGKTREALEILDRLFDQGEDEHRLLGAFSWQLRRLAQAARLSRNGRTLYAALGEVGVFRSQESWGKLIRHLGWRRLDRLYDWLIELDLGLKGSSRLPPRTLMERLVVQLARERDQRAESVSDQIC